VEEKLAESGDYTGPGNRFVRRALFRIAGMGIVALSANLGRALARELAGAVEEVRVRHSLKSSCSAAI
jgi:hypothetical protein